MLELGDRPTDDSAGSGLEGVLVDMLLGDRPDRWPVFDWREDDRSRWPLRAAVASLTEISPGPDLAAALERLDRVRLNGHEMVLLMEARSRQLSYVQAGLYEDMVELSLCAPCTAWSPPERVDAPDEYASDAISASLHLTRRAGDVQLDLAWAISRRLPQLAAALKEGRLDAARARRIVSETDHLDETTARAAVDEVIEEAESLTTGQIGVRLKTVCITADPEDAKKRHEQAVDGRKVVAYPNPDGTADLVASSLPADRVAAIMRRLNQYARNLPRNDTRTTDQQRADTLTDLLLQTTSTGGNTSDRPVVDISIDLPTLIGLADNPAEIPGWGPVIADTARQLIEQQPDGEWRIRATDPDTGATLGDGTTRRRPTNRQKRYIQTRNQTCVFPGCRMPSIQCDLDHNHPRSDGGHTTVCNLEPLCRHHHQLKHHTPWHLQHNHQDTRTYTWTSPHGHTYTTGRSP